MGRRKGGVGKRRQWREGGGQGGVAMGGASIRHSDSKLPRRWRQRDGGATSHICCLCHICSASRGGTCVCVRVKICVNNLKENGGKFLRNKTHTHPVLSRTQVGLCYKLVKNQ